jgi:hypothetical protein
MKKNIKKILASVLIAITLATSCGLITTAFAVTDGKEDESTTKADSGFAIPKPDSLPGPSADIQTSKETPVTKWVVETILPKWTYGTMQFVMVLAFLMLVISGIRYLTAYGNDEAATSAKKMAIYSLVALLITMFAYTIVSIIVKLKI